MTERELVEQCRTGSRDAQRELYNRTSQQIYRLLLKMTGSPEDAFDLSQETYLKAYSRFSRFDGRSSVATWLYRVAVNEALQFLRRAGKTRAKLREIAQGRVVESQAESTAVRLDMADALATLDPNDRAMLLLRYQEGLDYRAIAEVVECPAGTVASRLNRARHKLRNILQKSYSLGEENSGGEYLNGVERVASKGDGGDGQRRRTG